VETHFGRVARAKMFRREQLELIVGSLMGDGTLLRTTAGYCFRAHHGILQRALVDWKYRQLKSFVRKLPRASGSGYYFRTITHPKLAEMRSHFYENTRKIVPIPLLDEYLTPLAVAVWIMDDGAADGNQLRLNTQCFSRNEGQSLASLLERKYSLSVTCQLR